MLGDGGVDVIGFDAGVHVALPHPDVHLAAGDALQVGAQEHVGEEEDLLVLGDASDDLLGVAAGAAVVGFGLDLGAAVDVANHGGAGVLGLPLAQLVGGDRLGEAAA